VHQKALGEDPMVQVACMAGLTRAQMGNVNLA
jgi:hypothetical protein